MHTKRKYNYRNTGFSNMRDRKESKKENEKKVYKVCPWKAYAMAQEGNMLTREYKAKEGFYIVYLNGEFLQTCDNWKELRQVYAEYGFTI